MMKMKKFTGCVLIGLVMATSFTGCSLTNYKVFNNVFKYDKDANNELLYVDGDNNLVNLKNDGIYQLKPNSQVEILSDYGILLITMRTKIKIYPVILSVSKTIKFLKPSRNMTDI